MALTTFYKMATPISHPTLATDISDESAPLLSSNSSTPQGETSPDRQVPSLIANHLYVSHFLSTWNSRVFEFAAVLYLANIFPGTLQPMSLYALTRGISAILFSPAVGQYVDKGNRLQVARLSISMHYGHRSNLYPFSNIE